MTFFTVVGIFFIAVGLVMLIVTKSGFKLSHFVPDFIRKYEIEQKDLAWSNLVTTHNHRKSTRSFGSASNSVSFDMSIFDEDINMYLELFYEIRKDLTLFQAFNSKYALQELIVFSAAYILEYKVHYKTTYSHSNVFRHFDFIENTRTEDQVETVLNIVDDDTRKLLVTLLDKNLMNYLHLNYKSYEALMVNCALKLCTTARECQENGP